MRASSIAQLREAFGRGSVGSVNPIAARAPSRACRTVPAGPAVAVTARRSFAPGASTPQ